MSAMTSASVPPEATSFVCPPVASRSAPGRRTVTDIRSLPEGCAEVSLSPICDQHDDTARFFPRDTDRGGHRRAAGGSGEDALVFREPAGHRDGLIGRLGHVHIG